VKDNIQAILGLTPLQEGILFESEMADNKCLYSAQLVLHLSGPISINSFEEATHALVAGHESLRSVFKWKKVKSPVQIVLKTVPDPFSYFDLTNEPLARSKAQEFVESDRQTPFDLEKNAFRIALLKTAHDEYELILSNHHILLDGWSNSLILTALFAIYRSLIQSLELEAPSKPVLEQFRTQQLLGLKNPENLRFWSGYLKDLAVGEPFPIKLELSAAASLQVETVALKLDKEAIDQFSRRNGITVSTFMYGLWGLLLRSYHNTNDIRFGTSISHRPATLHDAEQVIGFAIQTLPLRFNFSHEMHLADYFKAVQENVNACFQHADISLSTIMNSIHLHQQSALFDTIFVVENYPLPKDRILADTGISLGGYTNWEVNNYPLSVSVKLFDHYQLDFSYIVNVFDPALITQLSHHVEHLLILALENPDHTLADVSVLDAAQAQAIIYASNQNYLQWRYSESAIDRFERTARLAPKRAAITFELPLPEAAGQISVDYDTLNNRANHLAQLLRPMIWREPEPTATPVVAVAMASSVDMYVTLLAIMKVGATSLPIDLAGSRRQMLTMLNDSCAVLLVCTKDVVAGGDMPLPVFCIDQVSFDKGMVGNPDRQVRKDDALYISYIARRGAKPGATLFDVAVKSSDTSASTSPQADRSTYWQKQCQDLPAIHGLPTSFPRTDKQADSPNERAVASAALVECLAGWLGTGYRQA
jgi:polyketide synthase PksJ